MNTYTKLLCAVLSALLVTAPLASGAHPHALVKHGSAIVKSDTGAIKSLLRKKFGRISISRVDVQGVWANTSINPIPIDSGEGANVILKKSGGKWRIIDYGTALEGAPLGVPKRLCEKWGI